ncbi:scaffold/adaptor protein [Lithospermum erythrorhizon]|uniref:Scaffold/adaptor protein n=1 Tax=Lithospermum erythrorhizon TaxID=34254 RepID=A0AAV3Q5I8_LITER
MMVFSHTSTIGGGGGGFLTKSQQVFPIDYEAEVSQRLLEATLANDMKALTECVEDRFVDVNYVGAVRLRIKKVEVVLVEEERNEVREEVGEVMADVTPLFLAVHNGDVALVRKLLSVGADVNQKLFRGFPATAAVRENHLEILDILLKAGTCQHACEEALLEASSHGYPNSAKLLMESDLIRPNIATCALFMACCRGFVNVVDTLMKCGVDLNAPHRVLLQSIKPSLHANADCTPLVAAVVSRQVSVVRLLLEAGVRTNIKVQLGSWSWDTASGEELRVGAGMAEPYDIAWCAVEYFEASGAILCMLLEHISPNILYSGRMLLHHAILCGNVGAVKIILDSGSNMESPVETTQKTEFRPLHMAGRLGHSDILRCLIESGCDLNSRTSTGDTPLMISARYKQVECLKELTRAGADFGLVNLDGQSANTIAATCKWNLGFLQGISKVIQDGSLPRSSNMAIFSPLMFVAKSGDLLALKALLEHIDINLDYQDAEGYSAVMVTAMEGHVDAFRLLVYAGADVKLSNRAGETAISLSEQNQNRDLFGKVMLEFALEKENNSSAGFLALHCAARYGNLDAVKLLTSRGYDVNSFDGEDYTPLMLAAREGHGQMCKLLISRGACCDIKNARGETALLLAKKMNIKNNDAVSVILDELAQRLVLNGSSMRKHTRGGKGAPHMKLVKMVAATGILSWGKSTRRNVTCREIDIGPSPSFQRIRQRKGDADEPGLFRVITTKNKEVHFVCDGGNETATLWVRGIKLLTKQAMSS